MDVVIAEVDYVGAAAEGAEGWSAGGGIVWRRLGGGRERRKKRNSRFLAALGMTNARLHVIFTGHLPGRR